MPACDKDWVDILGALSTVAIGLLAAAIAYGQWATERHRLKFELYKQCYEIYERVAAYMAGVLIGGPRAGVEAGLPGSPESLLRSAKEAHFLFGEAIALFIEKGVYSKAADIHAAVAMQENTSGDELHRHVERERELRDWFSRELGELPNRFARYLRLGD